MSEISTAVAVSALTAYENLRRHIDGPYRHGTETFLALEGVGDASKRKILWDNCLRLYGFDAQGLAASA